MQPVHVLRVHESVFDSPAAGQAAKKPPSSSILLKSPAAHASASAGKRTQREQRYIDASLHFSQLIQSPAAAGNPASTAAAAGGAVAPASATPTALPLSLLPFHRAFQSEGWRLAIATPEDRYTGRHLCTSLYALLWLKGPSSVLNYSSETHWIQKVRHMIAVRAAASLSGPRAASQDAMARPSLSEEAEFSLAHALHLPHTIIYSTDGSEKPEHEKMQLSSFPAHIWQRAHPAVDCDDGQGPGELSQFPSVSLHPSVWYFSRHAFQGQNEILRKNKPRSKQEHLDMLRSTFLGSAGAGAGTDKNKPRLGSAAALKQASSKTRPSSAVPSGSKWHEASHASLSSDPRLASVAHSPALSQARTNIVAQYTSLDRQRGTHVSYLTREDLEAFLHKEAATAGDATAQSTPARSRASSAARSRPITAGSSSAPIAADAVSEQSRKDRLRQSLYTDLYNEMDIMATPLQLQASAGGPGSSPLVAAAGTRPRPLSAKPGAAASDPLALHPQAVPSAAQFRGRQLVAMLQQFVHPPGEHAELLRVEWREEAVASWESRAASIARRKEAQQARAQRRRERRVQHSILEERDAAHTSAIEEEERQEAEAEQREAEAEAAQIAEDEAAEETRGGTPERRTVCYISRRLNANPLRALPPTNGHTASARSPSLYERACCFGYSDAAPPVIDSTVMNGVLYTRLSYVCDIVAQHIRSVSNSNLSPQSMSLFFQIDAQHDLHLLWCDRLIYWHEKPLLDGPGKEVEQRELEAKMARKDERRRRRVEEALAKHARAQRAEDPPISTPRLVVDLSDQYDAAFFNAFPKPSPSSAVLSEVLNGRYHKMPQARAHMNTNDSLLQGDENEAVASSVAPSAAPSVPPTQAASPQDSHAASAQSSPRDDDAFVQPSAVKSVSYARVTFPDSDADDEIEDLGDEDDLGAARTGRLKVTDAPSVVTIQLGGNEKEHGKEEESKTQSPQGSSNSMPAALDSDDEDDASTAGAPSNDPPDGLTALLQAKSDAALVEYKSGWADEILFDFARKRQQERNLFRQQEEAAFEAQTQKARNLFGSTVPVPGPAVGTPAALGSPTKGAKQQTSSQGVNLLEAGSQVNTSMLRSRSREGVTSSGAFLLAKAQRYASNTLGTTAPLGSKAFRAQLAMSGGLDLAPSGARSDWEGRGTPIGLRHGLHDMSGVGFTPGSRPIDNFRMRQVAAMAPPSERSQAHSSPSLNPDASRVSSSPHKDEFSRRVFAEIDAKGQEIRPLTTSASLSALGASMHNANAQMGRSSSSTSFAPPQPRPEDVPPQPSDSDEHPEEDGEPDSTFMTATALSPRSLANKARAAAPLGVGATRITLAASDPACIARALPASGGGYFVCPKCRLSLQIHAVHSTLVLDVIGEYERMVRFMSTHNHSFADEIYANFHRKRKGQTVPPKALHAYTDLSYFTEDSIPPALAFVFPSLTLAQYKTFKEDQGFLRSTIDLCEDCHLLVRVPVRPGGSGEEQHILEPLDLLRDEPQVVAPVIAHEDSAFDHPGAEYAAPGVSHGSTVARQKRREQDEATESDQFHRDERALAAQRAERHANGEVDLASAGRVVPFEIRRLNQSTMELLAHIPYNALEVAEFERKRALEAEALDPHSTAKSEAVAAILNKYRAPKQLGVAAVDREGSTLSHKRRAIQKELLIQVGVVPEPWAAPPRPIHGAAPTFVANPFMKPRPASAHANSPSKPVQRAASARRSSPGGAATAGAHANRGEIHAAQRSARFEAQVAAGPRAAMSRYDPNLPASLGGVQVVPAHDAALVQSEWRRDTTEAVVDAIIQRSAAERQRDVDATNARGQLHAPMHAIPAPSTFQQRFSHRQSAAHASAFSTLYSQIVRPKPLGHPVDHVAVQLEAKARERTLRERPAWAVKAEAKRIGVAPATLTVRADGCAATPLVAQPVSARSVSPSRASPLKMQVTPASGSAAAQLTQLAVPYAVTSPSPYLPYVSTVASNNGNMSGNATLRQPVM